MKKILNSITSFILIFSPVTVLCGCSIKENNSSQTDINCQNLTKNSFTEQNSILNDINSYINSNGNLYKFGMNPLSRIFGIKLSFNGYAKITIFSNNNNDNDNLTYFANKNNPEMNLIIPILFLYQNYQNKVKIEIFNSLVNVEKPVITNFFSIKIANVWNVNKSILKKPSVGTYSKEKKYLFFTSGNSKPVKNKIKSPYMAFDKYGQLRWILPQTSYDLPLQIDRDNKILVPIEFKNLVPNAGLSFYPFVESSNLIGVDWVGLKTNLDYDVSDYFATHEVYQQDNNSEIMIANRKDYLQNNLPPNDAIISVTPTTDSVTSKVVVYDQSLAWNNILKADSSSGSIIPLWKQFSFKFNDWLHLNALSKIDQDHILVSTRALNTIYDYDLSTKNIDWLITSSDALYNQIDQTKAKAILVKNKDDLFYGQHGLKFIKSENNKITFITLDNHFAFSTIESHDINSNVSQTNSYFKKITVDLVSKNYKIDEDFKIDKVTFMGNVSSINDNVNYVYTPNSGNLAFYNSDGKIIFKKFIGEEYYRVTPYLINDEMDFSF